MGLSYVNISSKPKEGSHESCHQYSLFILEYIFCLSRENKKELLPFFESNIWAQLSGEKPPNLQFDSNLKDC